MLKDFLKKLIVKLKNKGKTIIFGRNVRTSYSTIYEGYNRIGEGTIFYGKIGIASYMGQNCNITARIGRFSCISSRVITTRGTHPVHDWITIHPAFFSNKKQCGITFTGKNRFDEDTGYAEIGNDVWIGDSVLIVGEIKISDGAIIAAGSVVTKDVPPYAIVGGVPAKVIRYRFDSEEINKLLKLQWWNKPVDWLRTHVNDFSDINNLDKLQ